MIKTQEEFRKWLDGTPKDRYDKKMRELYNNTATTEGKAIIGLINGLVTELLNNLKKEQDENTTQISN
jgi:hypothetical protein